MKNNILFILSIPFLFTNCQNQPTSQEVTEDKDPLIQYLEENWQSPSDYVTSKFEAHDYVFVGEYHRVQHDVQLILDVIPKLHDKEIYNLGIEFADYRDQHLVDSLLVLEKFDRDLAREIMFKSSPDWGYKEYIDIYEVAWQVNQKAKEEGKPMFRVVNLMPHYDPCKEGGAWSEVDPDQHMADVIFKEFVEKDEKALIYSGNHHAFTKYHQPLYDFANDTLLGYQSKRMGNIIEDSLVGKTFNIYLHGAWRSANGWGEPMVRPVNGVIDSIMIQFENKPVGFDVVGTPFGELTSDDGYYIKGYPDFRLDQYCDGYVYTKPFKEYYFVEMEEGYIHEDNLDDLKHYLHCRNVPQELIDAFTVENANEELQEKAEDHFGNLMK
ncbi:MAG: ChaN family lipoprotein [Flavobacteriales bacterium]|nr:ChaN family lipoprotein [Flavobacteriales bacterium]